jgi:hypothetical protein
MDIALLFSFLSFFCLAFSLTRKLFLKGSIWFLLPVSIVLGFAAIEVGVGLVGRLLPWEWAFLACGGLAALAFLLLLSRPREGLPPWSFRPAYFSFWDGIYLLFFVGSTLLIGIVAFRYSFSDESGLQGHLSVVESILRGGFPPKFLAFPDIPYRYHYGFNLLAAVICRLLHLPAYWGVDILTVILWMTSLGMVTLLLEALGLPRRLAALGLLFILFSGGWSWWLARAEPGGFGESYQAPHWQLMYLHRRYISPNFVTYFFQHPMSLGIPFFTASLLSFSRWAQEKRFGLLVLTAFFLGALSLAHVMLFTTALAAYGLVFLYYFFNRPADKTATLGSGLFLGLASAALALALGGFFQFSADLSGQSLLLSWPPGYLRHEFWGRAFPIGWKETAQWYFSAFGWVLILLPYALMRAFRVRSPVLLHLTFFCILGFLIPQFFRYAQTWDVIKWFLAFEFSGRILIFWAYAPWILGKRLVEILAWLLVLSGCVTPFRFLSELAFQAPQEFRGGERRYSTSVQPQGPSGWGELFQEMRNCRDCRGKIWSSARTSAFLAIHTGFPVLQLDFNTLHMGISPQRLAERQEALARLDNAPSLDLVRNLQVRWIVFSCREFQKLSPSVQQWVLGLRKAEGVQERSLQGNADSCRLVFYLPKENEI